MIEEKNTSTQELNGFLDRNQLTKSQKVESRVEVTKKLGEGFVVAPWRWVVERTFSWLEKARRLCRDYEVLPENHEGLVYIVMIRLMLRRLTDNRRQRKLKINTA